MPPSHKHSEGGPDGTVPRPGLALRVPGPGVATDPGACWVICPSWDQRWLPAPRGDWVPPRPTPGQVLPVCAAPPPSGPAASHCLSPAEQRQRTLLTAIRFQGRWEVLIHRENIPHGRGLPTPPWHACCLGQMCLLRGNPPGLSFGSTMRGPGRSMSGCLDPRFLLSFSCSSGPWTHPGSFFTPSGDVNVFSKRATCSQATSLHLRGGGY